MDESLRELFLLRRDGYEATCLWYMRTCVQYKKAANYALRTMNREWYEIYLEAAKECYRRYRRLSMCDAQLRCL